MVDVRQKGIDAKVAASNLFTEIQNVLLGKQDAIAGKGLSEEDFTTTLKNKLNTAVVSTDIGSIVKVTASNYPVDPDPNVLYLVVDD